MRAGLESKGMRGGMRLPVLFAAFAWFVASPALALNHQPGWIADPRTGCTVWNPIPALNDSVSWSGACQNGVAQGPGVEQWFHDGEARNRVEGILRDGKPTGAVVVTYANGSRYQGELLDGKRTGQGVFRYANGNRYEGAFSDDKLSGKGSFTWANGERYVGEYKDGKRSGQGVYTFVNGDHYEGSFRDGKFDGKGVFTWADGERYDGEYRNDKRNGHGVYTYANGNRYEGEFRDSKRTGHGVFTWANGRRYEGEFLDGRIVGDGVYSDANGDKGGVSSRNATFVDGRSTAATPASPPAASAALPEEAARTPAPVGRGTSTSADRNEVRLQQDGGVLVVPVRINNAITLDFTIDSGASDVSVPQDVVDKLMRSGALTRADFLGKKTYELADGSTVRAQTFRIRVLKVGDREIENVVGSIADVGAGLLLGQTFLSRFRSWSIDNQRQMLVLE
jgi:predicted aspartyl protease